VLENYLLNILTTAFIEAIKIKEKVVLYTGNFG
jgi:hypothetical protein